ncbi:MAG: hypothetical protein N4A45_10800 [Flavobacteriales bacterium]|jgi:hypothetical protein|nr:hypothetical protein [Flavobacteriales bacterium]
MGHHRKISFLFLGLGILFFLAYLFGFKKTLFYKSEINQLQNQLKQQPYTERRIVFIEKTLSNISENESSKSIESFNRNLLEGLTIISREEGTEISFFEPFLTKEFQNYTSFSYHIKLIGDYKNLVKSLRRIEKRSDLGEVLSTEFIVQTKQNMEKTKFLELNIYIHQLKSKS